MPRRLTASTDAARPARTRGAPLSRFALTIALVLAAGVAPVSAQRRVPGRLEPTAPGVWTWVSSVEDSSNGVVFVGEESALLVDPGVTPRLVRAVLAAVREITDVPVSHVVLTSADPAAALGAICHENRPYSVIVHPRARRALAERRAHAAVDGARRLEVESYPVTLPDRVVEERVVLNLGRHIVEVFQPAGDDGGRLAVWSAHERVLAAGWLGDATLSPQAADDLAARDVTFVVTRRGEAQPGWGDDAAGGAEQVRRWRKADSIGWPDAESLGFTELAVLDAGRSPNQIAFSPDGRRAYVASVGEEAVVTVDAVRYLIRQRQSVAGAPLGVAVSPSGRELLVSRFAADRVTLFGLDADGLIDPDPKGELATGSAPSLIRGPLPDGRYLIAAEQADELTCIDGATFARVGTWPTGARPFPPSATSDGRLAFVPSYEDRTVTVVDLWNERVARRMRAGKVPCGSAMGGGDVDCVVALRGEDAVAIVNTAAKEVVEMVREGIGPSPFAVAATRDGRYAFIGDAGHEVSVLDLASRRVVTRIHTGDQPVAMSVHPSGRSLWISCEGSHDVRVVAIPEPAIATAPGARTQIAVLGMIHSGHPTSEVWGLDEVRETIRRFAPDHVLTEIPPDRLDRAWREYAERGVIEEPRVAVFPEYTEVLFPLRVQMGFGIEPCAGWTDEMNELRRTRMQQFGADERFAATRAVYEQRTADARQRRVAAGTDGDDPRLIHSTRYDDAVRAELAPYDELLNDWIGPGGWTNVNAAHLARVHAAIDRHPGERLLITFGAGHKHRILESLAARADVELVDVLPFLPAVPDGSPR